MVFGRNWVFLDYSSHVLWHLPKWTGIHPWRIYDQSTDLRMESGVLLVERERRWGGGRRGEEEMDKEKEWMKKK